VNVELVLAKTADGMSLHGILSPAGPAAKELPFDGALLLHGVGSNFYQPRLLQELAEGLTERGVQTIRGNTRGHDTIHTVMTNQGVRRQGAAYERIDECRLDIDAWLELLEQRGCRRVLLMGHSLGAIKAVYWQARQPRPLVGGLAAFSPPRLSAAAFEQGDGRDRYLESLSRAQQEVESGNAERLLEVAFPFPMTMSAGTFIDKYAAERYNVAELAGDLTCPALFTYAERELGGPAFVNLPADVAGAKATLNVEIVKGADHSYHGFCQPLMEAVDRCYSGGG